MIWSIFAGLAAIVISTLIFIKYKHSYWSRKNVPSIPTHLPSGNLFGVGKKWGMPQMLQNYYNRLKGIAPFGGLYFFISPVVLALDLDFIKSVLIKDFDSFPERGFYSNEKDDPLSAHLITLNEKRWRKLRPKLSPTFTSGRMKFMFPTLLEVADKFRICLGEHILRNNEVNIKELLARFSTDIIGSCAFGIECNSLADPQAQFRLMSRKHFEEPRNSSGKMLLSTLFPNIARALGVKVTRDDVETFFMCIVRETIELREREQIKRNDFMDLIIEIKNSGTLDGQHVGTLTFEEVAAQVFVFFLAGFETSSTTMGYAMHELALNPVVQAKARQEIDRVLQKHDGKLSYEASMEMNYLDSIINGG